MKVTNSKEIYVTAQMHKEYDWDITTQSWVYRGEEYPFAFLHPHEPGKKSDAKRKRTQLQWAYGIGCDQQEGIVYVSEWDYTNRMYTNKEPAKYQPRILSNEPLTGFEIFEVATRYSTSNKVFKVKDPRGFVTEITAKSLLGILLDGTIKNGVIQDACVWQANKNLVVAKE